MTSVGNEPLVKIKEYPTLVKPWSINPSLLTQLSLRDENRKANTSLHHVFRSRKVLSRTLWSRHSGKEFAVCMGTSLISVSGRAFPFLTKTFGAGFSVRTRMPAGIHCRQGTVLYEKECEPSLQHPVSWQDICRASFAQCHYR